jgi:uncharacterized protein
MDGRGTAARVHCRAVSQGGESQGRRARYTTAMSGQGITDRLRDALSGTPGLVSAYLFGSAAEDRLHRESDLDVAVLLDRAVYPTARERFDERLALMGTLRRASDREVDLVIINEAPPHLARHIMTRGVCLLRRDTERDHAHLRLVLSRAADLEPFLRRTRAIKLRDLAP